jgi:hypothetical protein
MGCVPTVCRSPIRPVLPISDDTRVWSNWQELCKPQIPHDLTLDCGTISQAVSRRLLQRWPGFKCRSHHVGTVVDKVALEQVFSEYFAFPCQFSFHRLFHTHHLSYVAGTIGQLVAEVPSGISFTPPWDRTRAVATNLTSWHARDKLNTRL